MRGSWLWSEAEQTDEVTSVANLGASTSSVTASPCHLPLIGEGFKGRKSKAPLPGADSPYQGEMSRRDKRGRELSAEG